MRCALFFPQTLMRCASKSFSVLTSSIEETVDVKSFFPSDSFMQKFIRRPSHRDKLSSLISELQVFLEVFGADSLPRFDDSIWSTYFSIWSAEERCEFLADLRVQQKSKASATAVDHKKISVCNPQAVDISEITYAPNSNSFIELRGQEFRRVIDRMYGSRLLSLERCDEMLPKVVIDCRFLAEYSVTVQSTFARHLIFRYGPPSLATSYCAHPFAPTLTARSVLEACGVNSSDIMYISWRATRFLPEKPPSNIRAVVICVSNDYQAWSSSISAAQKDGIIAYRLPIERYARFIGGRKFFSLRETCSVLRSYFRGGDIGKTIREAIELLPKKSLSNDSAEKDLLERYKTTIQIAAAKIKEESRSFYRKKPNDFQLVSKSPRTHRYTREERRNCVREMK